MKKNNLLLVFNPNLFFLLALLMASENNPEGSFLRPGPPTYWEVILSAGLKFYKPDSQQLENPEGNSQRSLLEVIVAGKPCNRKGKVYLGIMS